MENELKKAIKLWSPLRPLVYDSGRTVVAIVPTTLSISEIYVFTATKGAKILYADILRFIEDAIDIETCTLRCERTKLNSITLPEYLEDIIKKTGSSVLDDWFYFVRFTQIVTKDSL